LLVTSEAIELTLPRDVAQLLLGDGLRLALQAHAFLDQRLEHLAAFGLRLGERAHAGQPDLLRGILDGAGELAVEQAGGGGGLLGGDLGELLDHVVILCCLEGARPSRSRLEYRRSLLERET
jgi:hypothetical protein